MNITKSFLWVLLLAWAGGSTYWHVCKIKQLCDMPVESTVENATSPAVTALTISDGKMLNLHAAGNFGFAKSGAKANLSQVKSEMDSLVSYAVNNPGKIITITGLYSPDETNITSFPDLGIARAADIKSYLHEKGLPDSLMIVKGKRSDVLVFAQDSIQGGIDFSFTNRIAVPEKDLAQEQKYESIFKPIDLYFPSASSDYTQTEENEKFLTEAKKFLADNKDKKLLLTGYTDSDGSEPLNLALSRKRANIVKNRFIAQGMPADRILTDGKGESDPKAPNDTPAGKRANRRVTIVVL
jgi:OOP family OmpA-OmpF porin